MTKNTALTNDSLKNLLASQEKLKARLPSLNPTTAESMALMFSQPRTLDISCQDEISQWFLSYGGLSSCPQEQCLVLESDDTKILLNLTHDQWTTPIGERPWQDYEGESRLLAWNLAHEEFLQHLSEIFQLPLRATAFTERSDAENLDHIYLNWTAKSNNNNAIGHLMVAPTLLVNCLTLNSWHSEESNSKNLSHDFVLSLLIHLSTQYFTLAELKSFQTGDIMLIDKVEQCWHNLTLCTSKSKLPWHACYNSGQLTVMEPGPYTSINQETTMPEQKKDTPTDDQTTPVEELESDENTLETMTTQLSSNRLDSLSIDVSFQVGELQLTLNELQKIQPGYIFDLQKPLESANTLLLANGQCIGKGELVMVGDTLGICLTSIDNSGIE